VRRGTGRARHGVAGGSHQGGANRTRIATQTADGTGRRVGRRKRRDARLECARISGQSVAPDGRRGTRRTPAVDNRKRREIRGGTAVGCARKHRVGRVDRPGRSPYGPPPFGRARSSAVEHLTFNQRVDGSIPSGLTNKSLKAKAFLPTAGSSRPNTQNSNKRFRMVQAGIARPVAKTCARVRALSDKRVV
jgi:hypothetical protein